MRGWMAGERWNGRRRRTLGAAQRSDGPRRLSASMRGSVEHDSQPSASIKKMRERKAEIGAAAGQAAGWRMAAHALAARQPAAHGRNYSGVGGGHGPPNKKNFQPLILEFCTD